MQVRILARSNPLGPSLFVLLTHPFYPSFRAGTGAQQRHQEEGTIEEPAQIGRTRTSAPDEHRGSWAVARRGRRKNVVYVDPRVRNTIHEHDTRSDIITLSL